MSTERWGRGKTELRVSRVFYSRLFADLAEVQRSLEEIEESVEDDRESAWRRSVAFVCL